MNHLELSGRMFYLLSLLFVCVCLFVCYIPQATNATWTWNRAMPIMSLIGRQRYQICPHCRRTHRTRMIGWLFRKWLLCGKKKIVLCYSSHGTVSKVNLFTSSPARYHSDIKFLLAVFLIFLCFFYLKKICLAKSHSSTIEARDTFCLVFMMSALFFILSCFHLKKVCLVMSHSSNVEAKVTFCLILMVSALFCRVFIWKQVVWQRRIPLTLKLEIPFVVSA